MIETPPGEGNQSSLATLANTLLPALLAVDPNKCGPVAKTYACNHYFRSCPADASDPAQAGTKVCQRLCQRVMTDCATVFVTYAAVIPPGVIPNCSAVDADGQPVFPDGNYTVTMPNGQTYVKQCYGADTNITAGCPAPLAYMKYEAGVKCQRKCPRRYFTKTEFKAMNIVLSILIFPVIIADILMIGLILITPSRRRWPSGVPMFMFLGNLIVAIGFTASPFGGYEKIWCTGNDHNTMKAHMPAACLFQAILFIYGIEAFVLWWMWQAILIVETIVVPRWTESRLQMWIAHITSWGLPMCVVVWTLVTKSYGYAGDAPACFFRINSISGPAFWHPIMGLTFLVLPLLIFAAAHMIVRGGMRALLLQWRLLVMVSYSFVTYALLSAFNLDLQFNTPKYVASYGDYILCVLTGGSKCRIKKKPSFGLEMTFYIMWELTGPVYAFIGGLDREFLQTYHRLRKAASLKSFLIDSWSHTTSRSASAAAPQSQSEMQTQSAVEDGAY